LEQNFHLLVRAVHSISKHWEDDSVRSFRSSLKNARMAKDGRAMGSDGARSFLSPFKSFSGFLLVPLAHVLKVQAAGHAFDCACAVLGAVLPPEIQATVMSRALSLLPKCSQALDAEYWSHRQQAAGLIHDQFSREVVLSRLVDFLGRAD
jgi:hypothetical protein